MGNPLAALLPNIEGIQGFADAMREPGNVARTAAHGVVPWSDEILGRLRSLMGEDYDAAHADEQSRLSGFADRHPVGAALTELAGGAAPFMLSAGASAPAQLGAWAPRLAELMQGAPKVARGAARLAGASGLNAGLAAGDGETTDERVDNAEDGALFGIPGLYRVAKDALGYKEGGEVDDPGVEFTFDPDTPDDVKAKRIANWRAKNRPPGESRDAPGRTVDPIGPGDADVLPPGVEGHGDPDGTYKTIMGLVGRLGSSMALGPQAAIRSASGGPDALGTLLQDKGFGRTALQGVSPWSDEALAWLASKAKGTSFDAEHAKEESIRKGYEDRVGKWAALATELGGGVAGLALPVGAGLELAGQVGRLGPWAAKLAGLARNSPKITAGLAGAVTGGVQGAGVGDGIEERAENAKQFGLAGAVLGPATHAVGDLAKWALTKIPADSAMGSYLRNRVHSELGDKIEAEAQRRGVALPMTPEGKVDVTSPQWSQMAESHMRRELDRQRKLSVEPRVADILPGTTEAVLQKPGAETDKLARSLANRQFNWDLDRTNPALAAQMGQRGRVSDAFDNTFGGNVFGDTEDALLKARSAKAKPTFDAAYAQNVKTPEITKALDNVHIPGVWDNAIKLTDASGPGKLPFTRTGFGENAPVGKYNVEFLHNIKKALDDKIAATQDKFGRVNNEGRTMIMAKNELNEAIKAASPEYKKAMEDFGEDSGVIDALRNGRDKLFQSEDKGGMSIKDVTDFLNDANIPQAQKDMFRVGAARALRAKMLEPTGKAFTHNWAKDINAPGMEERMRAIVENPRDYDLFRQTLKQESQNFGQVARATQNSRTNPRAELVKELEGVNPGEKLAQAAGDTSWKGLISTFLKTRTSNAAVGEKNTNRIAALLAASGRQPQNDALRRIRDLMTRNGQTARSGDQMRDIATYTAPAALPAFGTDRE